MTGRAGQRGFGRIRKLPSGRWQANYAAPDLGPRINAPVTFFTKADAEGWLGLEHRKIARGAGAPARRGFAGASLSSEPNPGLTRVHDHN